MKTKSIKIGMPILLAAIMLVAAPIVHGIATEEGGSGYASQVAEQYPMPNDPDISKQASVISNTDLREAWSLVPATAGKVRVAVLDNGFDTDHEDLSANINMSLAWNAYDKSSDVSITQGYESRSHGTHVAGIIGAVTDNGIGVAGMAYNHAEIVPIKTSYIHTYPDGKTALVPTPLLTAAGINKAAELGCRIINISNGTYMDYNHPDSKVLERAVKNATSKGIVIIAGGGNGSTNNTMYPSDYDDVISVVAVTDENEHADYSDVNEHKNISAPGMGIYSTVAGGYGIKEGTSMAAPFVTSTVALMLAANPKLTADKIKTILYSTATDLGTPGHNDIFGYGLVNPGKAVAAALRM